MKPATDAVFPNSFFRLQTGFELPLAPCPAGGEAGTQDLFGDNFSQPVAVEGEPVFWPGGSAQTLPAGVSVHSDAPDCARLELAR